MEESNSIVFLLHTCSSWFMLGLIWLVQLVHYPTFSYVSREEFLDFSRFHTSRISMIVLPVMLVELVTGLLMVVLAAGSPYRIVQFLCWLNLSVLLTIWLSTFLISVPCHNKLAEKQDEKVIQRLVKTNWVRTILWCVKSILMIYLWRFLI